MREIKEFLISEVTQAIINCNSNLIGPEYFVIFEGKDFRYKVRNRIDHLKWFLKNLEKLPSSGVQDPKSRVHKIRPLTIKQRERIIARLDEDDVI